MATVTFILGLCGSGKSHHANNNFAGITVFDEGFFIDPAQQARLFSALRDGKDCAVVEIHYCIKENRQTIEAEINQAVPGTLIDYVCFENDLATANENCRKRRNKGNPKEHIEINERLTLEYTCPPGAIIRKIFSI
jgi:hypothetical protein